MHAAKSSLDLFGRPISLARLVLSALNPRAAGAGSGSAAGVTLVRLAPPLLVALRRMQRVMQVLVLCPMPALTIYMTSSVPACLPTCL